LGWREKERAKVVTLSGGQRRRLDVALGIIGSPEILDEPTTGFYPEGCCCFWDLIRTLRDEGTTILLTAHLIDEAEALADRVAVINNGRLLEVSTPVALGGRADAKATISWSENGVIKSEITATPTAFLKDLAARTPGGIQDLTVTCPSLEDIYLRMIGEA
jgi:ABC-2 type transport system ATP-binding protein